MRFTEDHVNALASFLQCGTSEISPSHNFFGDAPVFDVSGGEYLVCDADEKQEALNGRIEEMLWMFNPSFLANWADIDEEVIKIIQESKYDDANEPIKKLVNWPKTSADIVETAERDDGAGQFLSGYDGEEHEFYHNGQDWFIYRIN
jgi:hypothetical protein